MSRSNALLLMQDIHVSYREVKAVRGVDFDLNRGEIHALVGEHRAGKTTLVKVLSGSVRRQQGRIRYNGEQIEHFTPQTAIQQGIGMVYQDANVLGSLNAVENIYAGKMDKTWCRCIDYPAMIRKTEELFDKLHISVDVLTPLCELPKADQHMVELARALAHDPRLIILDELSSKLTPNEMEIVYPIILQSREQGKSIIYITHDMDEVFQFADRVTVLKDGMRTGTEKIKDLDRIKLIKLTYSYVLSRNELERDNINLYYFKKYNEDIIKNLPVGVIILDPANRVYIINFSAEKTLGRRRRHTEEHHIEDLLSSLHHAVREEVLEKIREKETHTWKEVWLKDGKCLNISIYPFQDEDYQFLGTIILLEDVTQYRRFMDYLVRAEKIASVAELAAGIAHEVNNPLGIIQNYVEILKDEKLQQHVMQKIGKIDGEIRRIEHIVSTLLSFSRLNELPTCTVNLSDVLDDAVLLLNHRFREKKIAVNRKGRKKDAVVLGDENRLKQLFINLLVNSIEAVSENGRIDIAEKYYVKRGFVLVDISDDGCGIPEDLLPSIFHPFFSTKRGKKNTGLGLAICQHIVDLHHGIITCDSRPGTGTTFSIRFQTADGQQPVRGDG